MFQQQFRSFIYEPIHAIPLDILITSLKKFFADALSRQFDRVYLENKSENLSKYFGELHPPVKKSFIGCQLNNEQF